MICPRCNSQCVSVQVVANTYTRPKHKGIVWWVLIGWWWMAIKWTVLALPALVVSIFKRKPTETVTRTETVCVCQNCGFSWK